MSSRERLKTRLKAYIDGAGDTDYTDIPSAYYEIEQLEKENASLEKRLERMTKLASSLQEKLGKNV